MRGTPAHRGHPSRLVRAGGAMLLLAGSVPGCETEPEPADPAPGTPLEIQETPRLSIGSIEARGPEELHEVAPPSFLPDGSVLVPLREAGALRVFDSEGDFVESRGRLGSGPGEFRSLRSAWTRGDTLEAWDPGAGRITRFLPGGELETVSLGEDDPRAPSPTSASFVGATDTGWLMTFVTSVDWGERDRMAMYHFALDGTSSGEEFGVTPGMQRERHDGFTGPPPLSPAMRLAFRRAGGGELYVAETLEPEIDVFDVRGRHLRSIRWEPRRGWDPEEAFDRIVQVVREGRGAPFTRGRPIPYPEDWPMFASPPDRVPVFSDFMVDELGFIWIRPYLPERDAVAMGGNVGAGRSGPGGEWMILTAEGEWVGEVRMPEGLEPYAITPDEVLGIYRDELDVEHVRTYPLARH